MPDSLCCDQKSRRVPAVASIRRYGDCARPRSHVVQVAGIEHAAIGTDLNSFAGFPDDLEDARELNRLT